MEVRRGAVRWTVAVSETAGGGTSVRWREAAREPGGVAQGRSAAPECCSEPTTLGGATPRMWHWFRLQSKGVFTFPCSGAPSEPPRSLWNLPLCFCKAFWVDWRTDSWNCWANSSGVKLSQGLERPLMAWGPSLACRGSGGRKLFSRLELFLQTGTSLGPRALSG